MGWGRSTLFTSCLAAAALAAAASADEPAFVSVGTGSTAGLYYPIGRSICEFVNQDGADHGVRCSVEPTVGSVYNLNKLATGELDLAIVQADVAHEAYRGVGRWSGRPVRKLRSVLGLYPELLTILARKDAAIASIADLKGKRVDIGTRGSGAHATWELLEAARGVERGDLKTILEMRPSAADPALCAGSIDASVQMVGHPSPRVAKYLESCALVLVAATGAAVEQLLAKEPYLQAGVIEAATYGQAGDVATFGTAAILVANADAPPAAVAAITAGVLDNIEEVRRLFPVLAHVDADKMLATNTDLPRHPGVELALRKRAVSQ